MSAALNHLIRSVMTIGLALLTFAAIGYCSKARAQDVTVGVHLVTAHFGGQHLEPKNPGLYLRHSSGATVGTYRNSYARQSTYAAWSWETADRSFALTAGAVTGYSAARVMPLLVPSARIPFEGGVSLRVAFIPKPVRQGHAAGLHLSTEFDF